MEHKKRHHQVQFSDTHTTYQLARESPESGEGEPIPEDSDLGEPPELEPGVTSFPTGSAGSSEEEGPPSRTTIWGVMWMGDMEGWGNQDPWLVEGVVSIAGSAQL